MSQLSSPASYLGGNTSAEHMTKSMNLGTGTGMPINVKKTTMCKLCKAPSNDFKQCCVPYPDPHVLGHLDPDPDLLVIGTDPDRAPDSSLFS